MNCSKAHKLISPYIDGELPESEMKTLEDHIKVCSGCRTELEESRELHNLFSKADTYKAPYGFHARVMASLTSGKTKESSESRIFVRLAEALVILVVITFGVVSGSLMINGNQPDKTNDVIASLSLDVFDSAPPGSLSGVYIALTEVRNEK
ncbi:MAG: anti-sigma factor family protein [Thermodesulfovibrionales bacterium]